MGKTKVQLNKLEENNNNKVTNRENVTLNDKSLSLEWKQTAFEHL